MTEWIKSKQVNGSSQTFLTFPITPTIFMICPKCDSEKTKTLSLTYPSTFECDSCGHVFLETKKSLIDE